MYEMKSQFINITKDVGKNNKKAGWNANSILPFEVTYSIFLA